MNRHRGLIRLSYLLGAILVVLPLVDLAANALPWTPLEVNWRYGSYTLMSGFLMTPVLGITIVAGAALLVGHRIPARVAAVVAVLLAVIVLADSVVFALDAIQLSATVPAEATSQFRIGVGKAAFKNVAMAGALLAIGLMTWRAAWSPGGGEAGNRVPVVGVEDPS